MTNDSILDKFLIPDLQRIVFEFVFIDALDAMYNNYSNGAILLFKSSRKGYASHLIMISKMLHLTVIRNDDRCFKWLFEELIRSYQQHNIKHMCEPFEWVAQHGRLSMLIFMVEQAKIEKRVELKPSVDTLTLAVKGNQSKTFKWLFERNLIAIDYRKLKTHPLCLKWAIGNDNLAISKCIWQTDMQTATLHLNIKSMRMFRWLHYEKHRTKYPKIYMDIDIEHAFKNTSLTLINFIDKHRFAWSDLYYGCYIEAFKRKRFDIINWIISNIPHPDRTLRAAVASNDLQMVIYVQQHTNASIVDALFQAIECGYLTIFEHLANSNLDTFRTFAVRLANDAAVNGQLSILKYIVTGYSSLFDMNKKIEFLHKAAYRGHLFIIEYFNSDLCVASEISAHWIYECAIVAIKQNHISLVNHIFSKYAFQKSELVILLSLAIEISAIDVLLRFESFVEYYTDIRLTIYDWNRINIKTLQWIRYHKLNFDWKKLIIYNLKYACDPCIFDWIVHNIGFDYVVNLNIKESFVAVCNVQYNIAHIKQFHMLGLLTEQVFAMINLCALLRPSSGTICCHAISFEGVQWLMNNNYHKLVANMWRTIFYGEYTYIDHDRCNLHHIVQRCKKIS